jgi:hypothetical protein
MPFSRVFNFLKECNREEQEVAGTCRKVAQLRPTWRSPAALSVLSTTLFRKWSAGWRKRCESFELNIVSFGERSDFKDHQ